MFQSSAIDISVSGLGKLSIDDDIPGVFPARQVRSMRIRDKFIENGILMLNRVHFDDLHIADLSARCGGSVGSFYTRFEDKDAYFRALRSTVASACAAEVRGRVNSEFLRRVPFAEALDEMVEVMSDLFCGPMRGVLREALTSGPSGSAAPSPMDKPARDIVRYYQEAYAGRLDDWPEDKARKRIAFCFQLVLGAMISDLTNDLALYSLEDDALRSELKTALRAYMRIA